MKKMNVLETRYLGAEDKEALLHRLNRVEGQVRGLRRMVEEAECVDKLLIQVSAAKAALTQVALDLMEHHLVRCAETCMEGEREEIIRRVVRAVASVLRKG